MWVCVCVWVCGCVGVWVCVCVFVCFFVPHDFSVRRSSPTHPVLYAAQCRYVYRCTPLNGTCQTSDAPWSYAHIPKVRPMWQNGCALKKGMLLQNAMGEENCTASSENSEGKVVQDHAGRRIARPRSTAQRQALQPQHAAMPCLSAAAVGDGKATAAGSATSQGGIRSLDDSFFFLGFLLNGLYASWPVFFFCHLLGASQGYTPGCGGHEQGHSRPGGQRHGN